jgi:hypothetical protein
MNQPFQRVKHRQVLGKGMRGETDPEVEQVTHDVEGVQFPFKL